jgi:hypothetical protein
MEVELIGNDHWLGSYKGSIPHDFSANSRSRKLYLRSQYLWLKTRETKWVCLLTKNNYEMERQGTRLSDPWR